ncbi:hypothetical protein E3P91_00148 [Wallemia ichthyophaga]|nr:hypothetical protein E3P91_00148 [Wallemia ichthyophaga]
MAQTQTQSQARQTHASERYETIHRLLQIPLIRDGLEYSNDVLQRYPLAQRAWSTGYGLATGVSLPLLNGPLNKPAQMLDIYSLHLLEYIASTFPYAFQKNTGEVYHDVKQPLDTGKQRINADIVTPALLHIENLVHRFIPASEQKDTRDLSPATRTILLKNEVTDYLTTVSTDQWKKLRQNEWVHHYAEFVADQTSSFLKAVSESKENIEGRTNDLLNMLRSEKEKIEGRVARLPTDARKRVEPAFQRVENAYKEMTILASDETIPARDKATKLGDFITCNAVPVLKSLQEMLISTEKELEKTVNDQTEKFDEKKDKGDVRSVRSAKKGKGSSDAHDSSTSTILYSHRASSVV